MSKIKIIDESGDKKYFTIVPNYILNHSTLWDREVYIQMKRITGEGGTCWTSQSTLAKQCGISINRLKKSLKYLIEHKWIKLLGTRDVETKGGIQEVNKYSVADLWKMNADFYEAKGVSQKDIPITKGVSPKEQRGITGEAKGVSPGDDKEEHREEDPLNKNATRGVAGSVFSLEGELKKLKTDPKRHIQLIGEYLEEKDVSIKSCEQLKVAIKRHARAAVELAKFSDEQIGKATEIAEKEYPSYTLETLTKILTR